MRMFDARERQSFLHKRFFIKLLEVQWGRKSDRDVTNTFFWNLVKVLLSTFLFYSFISYLCFFVRTRQFWHQWKYATRFQSFWKIRNVSYIKKKSKYICNLKQLLPPHTFKKKQYSMLSAEGSRSTDLWHAMNSLGIPHFNHWTSPLWQVRRSHSKAFKIFLFVF